MKKILIAMLTMAFILTSIVLAENQTTNNTFTLDQVASHDTREDCYLIIDSNVYDVTDYISIHPGGIREITNKCGEEATKAFNTQGGEGRHSSNAKKILANYKIGTIYTTSTNSNNNSTNNTNNETILDRYYQALEVRYEHLECKVELTSKQIELFDKYLPELNLNNYNDKIVDDLEQLKEYNQDKDKEAFNTYLESEFKKDFINATSALINAKKNFKNYNLTNETKKEIITELKEYKQEYSECTNDKQVKMAKLTYKHFEKLDEQWEKSIEKMSKRGVNAEELENLKEEMGDRREKIQDLIESEDYEELNIYLKELRKEHLKLAARFEIEELKEYNDRLKSEAKKYGVEKSFEDIDRNIENAEKKADRGRKYEEKDMKETWDSIRDANKEMRETSKNILKERRSDDRDKNESDDDYDDSDKNNSDNDSEEDD